MAKKFESEKCGARIRSSSAYRVAVVVFIVALSVRLIYLAEYSKSPLFNVPIIDSQSYDQHARVLISEKTFYERFFWQGFFYPFFLAGVYIVSGASTLVARMVQIVLGSLSCAGVCVLGAKLFDKRIGLLAGLIAALYGPLIYYDAEILDAGWSAIWAVVMVLVLIRASEGSGIASALLFGFIAGLSSVTRATFLPFVLVSGLWLVFSWSCANRKLWPALSRIILLVLGFLIVTLPVASLAKRSTGSFDFLPVSGSLNLYIGNNPNRESTIMIRPGAEWRELIRLPALMGSMSSEEKRAVFMRLFLDYVRKEPLSYLSGLVAKTVQFVSSRELPRNTDIYLARKWSKVISILLWRAGGFGFPFGLLFPFALVGLITARNKFPAPIWLFLVLYPASVIAVFVSGRYRVPVVPILAVPAAVGVSNMVDCARAHLWKIVSAALAFVCLVAVSISIPGSFAVERYNYEAEMHTSIGFELMRKGRTAEAEEEFSRALALDPLWPAAHRYLGILAEGKRNHSEAEKHFRAALEQDPDSCILRYYLGVTLLNMGRREEGLAELRSAREGAVAAKEEELLREINKLLGLESK